MNATPADPAATPAGPADDPAGADDTAAGPPAGGARPARFRRNGTVFAAALIAVVAVVPLATASRWLFPLLLVPLAVAGWAWRSGTAADERGLTVTALLGRRRIGWDAVAAVGPDGSGGAAARLDSGTLVPLPAVREADLPRLLAATTRFTPA
ncbi:PH domain-containing protein [Pilimelia anulata]|uniref:PH domain-containing protein n=1 Tax=Pilimelia anulata TaxID=53371 RepID=UPI003570B52E